MRSPNRLHDRQCFYKYMSADVARKVLTGRSLRWSSPLLFNDPFDVPRELSFGITPEELAEASKRLMIRFIETPPNDTTNFNPKLRLILDAVKRGISPELRAELLSGIEDAAASSRPTGESMEQLRAFWRTDLPNHRILCLTESPCHAAMWYHYADKYKGVVLEFRCIDELDSPWLAARQVTYPTSKPSIYSADGWAELLCLEPETAIRSVLQSATYTKSPDWSYESEWRVASFKRPDDIGNYTHYTFNRQELAALYFGPKIDTDNRLSLRLAAGAYPAARLWDVEIGMSREFTFVAADL